ncbi:MAG: hypothetical protein ACYST2_03130 [Planctomycetota bacterium]
MTPQQEQDLADVVQKTQYQTASANTTDFTGALTVNGQPIGGGGGGSSTVGALVSVGRNSWVTSQDLRPVYEDDWITVGWDAPGNDIEITLKALVGISNYSCYASRGASNNIQTTTMTQVGLIYDIYPNGLGAGDILDVVLSPTFGPAPSWRMTFHNISNSGLTNGIVERYIIDPGNASDPTGGGGGGGSGIEVGTKSELLAKTGMTAGQQFFVNANAGTAFTSQENKLYTYSGRTWQVSGETVELLLSQDMIEGNTVELNDGSSDFEIKKTNTSQDTQVIGVVALQGGVAGDWVTVATRGIWEVACENDTYNRASYLTTDATDGLATQTTSVSAQPFAKVLENRTINLAGGLVFALLHTCEIY